ncbi:MAG: hypothetical protein ACR2O7_05540 [Parasphingorhabdus sp.]
MLENPAQKTGNGGNPMFLGVNFVKFDFLKPGNHARKPTAGHTASAQIKTGGNS